jgi:hypothetical protein
MLPAILIMSNMFLHSREATKNKGKMMKESGKALEGVSHSVFCIVDQGERTQVSTVED